MTKPWKASASHARMRRIKTRIRLLERPKCCIRIENRKEGSMGRDDSTSWLLTFGGGSSSGRVIVDVDALGTDTDDQDAASCRQSGPGGPVRKSKRGASSKKLGGASNFRVVERCGQAIGMCSPYHTPWRAPFTVTALKLTNVYGIQASTLTSILQTFLGSDESKIISNLEKEFLQVAGKPVLDAEKSRRLLEQAHAAADASAATVQAWDAEIASKIEKAREDATRALHAIGDLQEHCVKLPTILQAVRHMIDPSIEDRPTMEEYRVVRDDMRAHKQEKLDQLDEATKDGADTPRMGSANGADRGTPSQHETKRRSMTVMTQKRALAHQTQDGVGDDEALQSKNANMASVMAM